MISKYAYYSSQKLLNIQLTKDGKEDHKSSRYLYNSATANICQGQQTSIFTEEELHLRAFTWCFSRDQKNINLFNPYESMIYEK